MLKIPICITELGTRISWYVLLYYNQLVKKIWCVIIAPTLRNTLAISFAFEFTEEQFL